MPPLPGGASGQRGATAASSNSLSIHYQGEVFSVTKDRFIIGRGKQTSDLTIKDPNVSRQHAAIEFLQGYYYMIDLGSRNGIGYDGHRIHKKQIVEGDKFEISGHALAFSFKNG